MTIEEQAELYKEYYLTHLEEADMELLKELSTDELLTDYVGLLKLECNK